MTRYLQYCYKNPRTTSLIITMHEIKLSEDS